MRLRKARIGDFNALYRIGSKTPELSAIEEREFMTRGEFKTALNKPKDVFLVAEEKDKIVGFAYSAIEKAEEMEMVNMVVLPSHRGRGIGRLLMEESERMLKKRGVKRMYALATNKRMVGMMKHMGYKEGKKITWMEKTLK